MEINDRIVDLLVRAGVVVSGPVTLRGGKESNVYYDIKKTYGDPYLLASLAGEMITKLIHPDVTCVAASGHGGIPLATAIAIKHRKLKLTLVRDREKDHGVKKLIDGHLPEKNDVVAIIDDVFSTGSSIRAVCRAMSGLPATLRCAYVVLDRSKKDSSTPVLVRSLYLPKHFQNGRYIT